MDLAERIDNIQSNDVWRSDPNSKLYERDRISARIDEFVVRNEQIARVCLKIFVCRFVMENSLNTIFTCHFLLPIALDATR
jgi:hypothetical protein